MSQIAFSFDKVTAKKVLKGALIATGGAFLTYLAKEVLPNVNFGDYTPVLVALFSILINAGQEYIAGEKQKQ